MQILILIAGLILKLACPDEYHGFNLDMIGLICIWIGAILTVVPLLFVVAGWAGLRSSHKRMERDFWEKW